MDEIIAEGQEQAGAAHFPNAAFDIVALALSAGGLAALSTVLGALPTEFPAAAVVVQHLDPRHRSLMAEILDYLEVHPEEFTLLFNTILINVTSFFREPAAWEFLRREVIPRILAAKGPNDPVRAWSAGCASGEEPYTLAMLLAQVIGEDAFRERVKIYATDIDEETLSQARLASYDANAVESVPAALGEKYFERAGGRFVSRNDHRRMVFSVGTTSCRMLLSPASISWCAGTRRCTSTPKPRGAPWRVSTSP